MQLEIDNASDQTILSALREGKPRQAAGLLISYHGNTVFNVCRSMVVDPELAEDLTQETFRRAFGGLLGIQGSSSPRAWLVGLAQQCCSEAAGTASRPDVADLPPFDQMASADAPGWRISESLQRRLEVLASSL
jgi:DNA-directed RNA polymerase specialized sigma24 family protein